MKLFEIAKIRATDRASEEVPVPDLLAQGYGLFCEVEDKPALVELALSESMDDKAEYVRLIDESAPEIAVEAAAILSRGMVPVILAPRKITSKLTMYAVVTGIDTVLAQLYNHCKTGIPARVKGTIV